MRYILKAFAVLTLAFSPFFLTGQTVQQIKQREKWMKQESEKRPFESYRIDSGKPVVHKAEIGSPDRFLSNEIFRGTASSTCIDTTLQILFREDTMVMHTEYITKTYDGNIVIAGSWRKSYSTYTQPRLIKCTPRGDVIWVKEINQTAEKNSTWTRRIFELPNHELLLAFFFTFDLPPGNPYPRQDDVALMKLSEGGDLLWQKTYMMGSWTFPHRPLYVVDIRSATTTSNGDIYICGGTSIVSNGAAFAARLSSTGEIIWSNAYRFGFSPRYESAFIVGNQLHTYGKSTVDAVFVTTFDTATGKVTRTRGWRPAYATESIRYNHSMTVQGAVRLANGNTMIYGKSNEDYLRPRTGPRGHWAVLEVSPAFEAVRWYVLRNAIDINESDYTVATGYPDGSLVFSISYQPTDGDFFTYFGKLVNGQVVKERIIHEGDLPAASFSNFIDINGGDIITRSKAIKPDMSIIGVDLLSLKNSGTSGNCAGIDTMMTTIVEEKWETGTPAIATTYPNAFVPSTHPPFVITSEAVTTNQVCEQISFCDSLKIIPSAEYLCPGKTLNIKIRKNKECGTRVAWYYDTTAIKTFTRVNDSSFQVTFKKNWDGYIYGQLHGCSVVRDSIHINISSAMPKLELGKDTSVCPGNMVVLNASRKFTAYEWQDGSTDSTFTAQGPGVYHVKVTDACGNFLYDTVKIALKAALPFSAGPDRSKCNSDTIHLNATPGFTNYSWSPAYNINNVSSPIVTVNPLRDTAYFVKAEQEPGCFVYDTVKVKVNYAQPIYLGNDTSFCSGKTLVLNAGAGFAGYNWSTGETSQQITVAIEGVYAVLAKDFAGCSSADTLKVNKIYNLPNVNLDKKPALCEGEIRILDAGVHSSYQWSNGSTSQTIAVNTLGTYSVSVTDGNGCTGGNTTVISKWNSSPNKFLPVDTALCTYSSLLLKANQTFDRYQWNNGSTSPTLNISAAGTYWLNVTDQNNCKGADTIVVVSKECMKGFHVPNAFSPNGDGDNDIFRPLLFGNVKMYEFKIFNRWGQPVYQTNTVGKGWDGNINGKPQDSNIFIWSCSYQLDGEEKQVRKGTVQLIR